MAEKGGITQIVNGARIVDGGKITSLATDFKTDNGNPFAIKLIPKSEDNAKEFEMVTLQLYQSDNTMPWPIDVLSWSSELIIKITTTNVSLLTDYDIYWGSGSDIQNN